MAIAKWTWSSLSRWEILYMCVKKIAECSEHWEKMLPAKTHVEYLFGFRDTCSERQKLISKMIQNSFRGLLHIYLTVITLSMFAAPIPVHFLSVQLSFVRIFPLYCLYALSRWFFSLALSPLRFPLFYYLLSKNKLFHCNLLVAKSSDGRSIDQREQMPDEKLLQPFRQIFNKLFNYLESDIVIICHHNASWGFFHQVFVANISLALFPSIHFCCLFPNNPWIYFESILMAAHTRMLSLIILWAKLWIQIGCCAKEKTADNLEAKKLHSQLSREKKSETNVMYFLLAIFSQRCNRRCEKKASW